ncbi:MAG TPA: ABC transporter substrate-binding protein [Candidatus Pelethocola excrementipullorum]|nr:ABC transporter substrate-binding protein [Candidatus Pelethocola excrementipullorum]
MRKKLAFLLCSTLLIGTLAAGCSGKTDDSKSADNSSSKSVSETSASADSTTKPLTKVTLNEVAHSIFYAPQYVAIEEGYFEDEGLDLDLVTGFGADKVLTALISGEAQIGFMGGESSIYAYLEGANDVVVNFAQLTQRAGNFLVSRENEADFQWSDLKGKDVLGGRKGGMPEMVFEYVLKQNGIDPVKDLNINQSIDFGSTAAAFSGGQGEYTVDYSILPHL